jgi:hypothetical protein
MNIRVPGEQMTDFDVSTRTARICSALDHQRRPASTA